MTKWRPVGDGARTDGGSSAIYEMETMGTNYQAHPSPQHINILRKVNFESWIA
jgi:hypothetical protein